MASSFLSTQQGLGFIVQKVSSILVHTDVVIEDINQAENY